MKKSNLERRPEGVGVLHSKRIVQQIRKAFGWKKEPIPDSPIGTEPLVEFLQGEQARHLGLGLISSDNPLPPLSVALEPDRLRKSEHRGLAALEKELDNAKETYANDYSKEYFGIVITTVSGTYYIYSDWNLPEDARFIPRIEFNIPLGCTRSIYDLDSFPEIASVITRKDLVPAGTED